MIFGTRTIDLIAENNNKGAMCCLSIPVSVLLPDRRKIALTNNYESNPLVFFKTFNPGNFDTIDLKSIFTGHFLNLKN